MSCNQYPNCDFASPGMCGNILAPQQNGGFPTERCEQVKHSSGVKTATEYLLSSANNANRLRESVERIKQAGPAKAVFLESDVFDIHQMIIDQNPERRTERRKPVTSLDWELQQALIHLQNAISVTDAHRAHLLQAALQITKGVRESD